MQYKLSVCIPARNEMWLKKTVEDILEHKEAETEIIVGLDGLWSEPPLLQHPDVNIVFVPESIGQRAITKTCAKLARGKYIMKCDAHCAFDQGFDRKMIEFMEKHGDNVTATPIMRNLWIFDWKCYHCGWKKYQGPTPTECGGCGKKDKIRRKIVWNPKPRPQSWSYCFDSEPHFRYWEEYKHRPGIKEHKDKERWSETMSLQGSCFMLTKEKYFELDIDDEAIGSWGNQGLSVACKTWLSGGRVLVNHDTFYAHCFRTQGLDFGFPYPQPAREVQATKKRAWDVFFNGKFDKQIHPVSWLIEKFSPVPTWDEKAITELKKKELNNK